MNLSRRCLFGVSSIAAAIMLSGCGMITSSGGNVAVNLANAQAEAKTIYTALTAFVTELADTVPASTKAEIEAAYDGLGEAVTAFANLPSGSATISQAAQAIINAVQSLVPLLPLPAVTAGAISTGLLLVSALISGLSSITVPGAIPGQSAVSAAPVISGPIPIPLG